jgi:hypothetical protein
MRETLDFLLRDLERDGRGLFHRVFNVQWITDSEILLSPQPLSLMGKGLGDEGMGSES